MNRWLPLVPPLLVYIVSLLLLTGPNYYEVYPNADNVMHFLGGASIFTMAYLATYKLRLADSFLKLSSGLQFLFYLSFVALFVVGWEVYEFGSDLWLGTRTQPSLVDTITDMVMGMLGGLLSISLFFSLRRGEK
ncbi:hypothetical protein KC644_02120 [Candidatus Berkelbacteria bacterium]|nr:hypothetical protein [Candidatus Berkelbacteria bacterium]